MLRFETLLHASHLQPFWRTALGTAAVLVCWFAFTPNPDATMLTESDKVDHLLAFVTLGGCGALSWRAGWRQTAALAFGLLVFGAAIELVQTQIPGRDGDFGDLLADSAGLALGLAAVGLLRRWRPAAER